MNDRLLRVAAIVRADFLIRFRRMSTLVVFLLLSAAAYLWIPAPATGRALMVVDGRRAVYNSAAVGMATALLGTIFVGLVGFYVVSNAIRRDVTTRAGFVMASTTMRGGEYLFGKFLGNVVFLATFMGGFMLSSMTMLLIRGEAPLQPLVFFGQYAILVPSSIAFVSALAILFESVSWLSGRFGDVVYFFLWIASLGVVASGIDQGAAGPGAAGWFDFSGLGFAFDQFQRLMHTKQMAIGASNFDPSKGTILFRGLDLSHGWLIPRIAATVIPVSLLPVARLFFHRFDPVRVRRSAGRERRGWLARINRLLKPLARPFAWVAGRGAAGADALLTIQATPSIVPVMIGLAIASVTTTPTFFEHGVLPVSFAALAVFLADVSCRERRAGTLAFVESAPSIRERFVFWKLSASLRLAFLFLFVPLLRIAITSPTRLLPFASGTFFVCATATALGVVSANAKTFIVLFLSFWYLVINSGGGNPSLDFAGFYGVATPWVALAYAATGAASIAAAHALRTARAD
ncbi:MAG TPA: hypothetical protein VKH35_03975 [Thermoanaerobaculia bacterium]|nr:hypothetical protein [Thermoanaerobaculia bacterium]